MLKKTLVYPTGFAKPRGAYSPGILLENAGVKTLYATGQLAVDPSGNVIAPGDATEQSEYVFKLLGEILQAAGLTFDHVVRAQTYLTDMADFPKFSAVRDRFFGTAKPASTLLEVKGLAHVGCCVEVEVTAMR
jgi:enamine deaminase RidA (YjgF/YER057c/UK114 family)